MHSFQQEKEMHNNAFFLLSTCQKGKYHPLNIPILKGILEINYLQLCLPAFQQSAEALEFTLTMLHSTASLILHQFLFLAFSTPCGHEFYNLRVV